MSKHYTTYIDKTNVRLRTLEAELAAYKVAVGVLAEICYKITDDSPDHDRDFLAWVVGKVTDPICKAAIDAAKRGE